MDDEVFFTDLFSQILSGLGYNVSAVSSSLNALEIFSSNPDRFDLLITDQTMPGVTGVELIRKIRDIRPEFPVILCTGFSDDIVEQEIGEINVAEILFKPVIKKDLAAAIRQVLDHE